MNRRLWKAAVFSLSVHGLLAVGPAADAPARRADVVRGASSVELLLMDTAAFRFSQKPLPPTAGETLSAQARPAPAQPPALDQGAFSRAKPANWKNPPPRYPWVARMQGWEGTVMIRATVAPGGRVLAAAVSRGSGHPVLDRAALESVKTWRFSPTRGGGPSTVEVPVTFRLDSE